MTIRKFLMVAALMLNAVWCQPKALAQCVATEHAKLLASDGTFRDFFGGSIAMAGNRVMVGDSRIYFAPGSGGNFRGGKTAYVFNFDGDGWKEEGRLAPADLQEIAAFGDSVAVLDDLALVGATFRDHNGSELRAVYVFRFDGRNWVEEDKLVAPDGSAGVGFGNGVAMIGNRVLVGSPGTNTVFVFRFVDGVWSEDVSLMPPDGAVGGSFGSALAVSGDDVVVVGAPGDDDNGEDSGAAYVFRFDGTCWTEEGKLTASDGTPSAWLGFDVALSGETALIGARGLNGNKPDHLAAYVFRRDNETWREEAKLTSGDNLDQQLLTLSSVAISGNVALLAVPGDEAAYVFRFDGTDWVKKARLTASDNTSNRFGGAVAILDDVAVIGAPNDDDDGHLSGSAYVFRGLSDCNQNDTIDACEITTGGISDCNANGIPDECDIATGAGGDCQPNGLPDDCELGWFTHISQRLFFPPDQPDFTIPSPPPARGIVSLRFTIGRIPEVDLDPIGIVINGFWFAQAFVGPSLDEPSVATTDTLFMNAEVFNTAVDGGDALISVEYAYVRHIMLEVEYDAVGPNADCNGNGVPDECDVADGTSNDCQSDGIPDECNTFVSTSPQLSPLIHPVVQQHTIAAAPRAVGEVSLFFTACCVGYENESIDVDINGTPVGRVYRNRCDWDTPQLDVLPVPAALFNAAVGYGEAVINMTPTPEVHRENPDSFVSVTVQYPIAQLADCQPNGISDACDLADGLSTDCDGDATPDECEPDADSDSIPDDCDQPGDFDHDADVDLADYELFWVCLMLSGPGEQVPFAECREAFDADRDGDIDLEDVADFARRLSP